MNEASSRFVDLFATEKLLNEKLSKVHHSPINSHFQEEAEVFGRFASECFDSSRVEEIQTEANGQGFKIPSPIATEIYPENSCVYLHYHPAPKARGNILLVHGLYDDNVMNYNFLIQLLNEAGFNLYLFILPYHYQRRPESSLFSGEYFWSADLLRSFHAVKQGIYDLKVSIRFIQTMNSYPTVIAGFSMGGNVSLRYFQLERAVDGLFLINPVTRLSQLFWESPLLRYVQKDLEACGYTLERVEALFQPLDPVKNIEPNFFKRTVALGYSIYDQIVSEAMYLKLVEQCKFRTTISYNAGHLNVLRVPKLASDIAQYFHSVVHKASYMECEG